jgi:hypothetical protein
MTTHSGRLTLTDTTQGQDTQQSPQNDASLFREALDAPTLEKFENPPELKPESQQQQRPAGQQPGQQPAKTETQQQDDAMVPSGRLREVTEARTRAERERDEYRARLAAYEAQPRQQPQQQEQPKKLDVFDNPSGFVKQEVEPLFNQFRQEMQMTREAMSADNAVRVYGDERVGAARAALEQGMARHDPNAWATYNRAMASHDPYGVITRWHLDRETLTQIGGDLETYKKRILEDALKDPEFHKQVIQAAKGQAAANGQQINRPAGGVVQPKVPTLPSLSDIGAAGPDEQHMEPSDEALFRAAVSAKRRG